MAEVDIVIPTRNRPHLTRQAVESVRAQTHTSWRLILVDDGSETQTVGELRRIENEDRRIELIERDEAGGAEVARQTGWEHSTAPYVAFLDSDDLWAPEKLASQLRIFAHAGVDNLGVVITWHAWVKNGRVTHERQPRVAGQAPPTLTNNMSTPLIARWALEKAGGTVPPGMRTPLLGSEHIEFYLRLTKSCAFAVVEDVLVTCRTHEQARESDILQSVEAADSLSYVLEKHAAYLARFPVDHARLLALTGARYLRVRRRRTGLNYLRRSFHLAPRYEKVRLLRRYAPFTLRALTGF